MKANSPISAQGYLVATCAMFVIIWLVPDVSSQGDDIPKIREHMILKVDNRYNFYALAFSPDSTLLAGSQGSKGLVVWELATGKPKHVLALDYEATLLAFSKDGKTIMAVGTKDRKTVFQKWDVGTGTEKDLSMLPRGARNLALSTDGTVLVNNPVVSSRNIVLARDSMGKQEMEVEDEAPFTCAAISADKKLVATGSAKGHLRIWSFPFGTQNWSAKGKSSFRAVHFTPDGKTLVTIGGGDTPAWGVRYWDMANGKSKKSGLEGFNTGYLAIAANGKYLAIPYSGSLLLWSIEKSAPMAQLIIPGEPRSCKVMAFSPNGRLLAATSSKLVRIWLLPKL